MRRWPTCLCLALACVPLARAADDVFDAIDDALTVSFSQDSIRARLSGSLEAEGYHYQTPPPGLILGTSDRLFQPRLSLYLDAQLGAYFYAFAELRGDRGFDPTNGPLELRMDQYAVRYTPWQDGHFNLQLGKFATVVGNWTQRHDAWDNPFITAPLPYENLTGIWDILPARSGSTLLLWANVGPRPSSVFPIKSRGVPLIWGPSYATGAAISGTMGKLDYAAEFKNASLSSRPDVWDPDRMQWQQPTVSSRLGYRPSEMWTFGLSASTGPYLRDSVAGTIAPGTHFDAYREILFGQDAAFAWHHWQVWSEIYETRFAVPRVGRADTLAYYTEAKFKFTPQLFGAVRWNQQFYSTIPLGDGSLATWGSNAWRIDAGPTYRFTPHTQLKLQYSFQRQDSVLYPINRLAAVQVTVRF